MKTKTRIKTKVEHDLSQSDQKAIAALLAESFPTYPSGRIFFKTMPSFRMLCYSGQRLVGHLAVDHRLINNGGQLLNIFGVVDLCVSIDYRHKGLATALLSELEQCASKARIDALVSIAQDARLYKQNGFKKRQCRARWIMISQNQMLGINQRAFDQSLWVKMLSKTKWASGELDFLGPLF